MEVALLELVPIFSRDRKGSFWFLFSTGIDLLLTSGGRSKDYPSCRLGISSK
jgi:hypothetical protein